MREIKFRYYMASVGQMIPVRSMYFVGNVVHINDGLHECAHSELMQYTGLHDKNGREIYEGDVIKFPKDHTYYSFYGVTGQPVEWDESGGWHPFANNEDGQPYPKPGECEVIGNVYENPELLK
jgi:uncharacterized phage protein (TIGR01671 family)